MSGLLKLLSILALLGFPVAVAGTRLGLFDFRFGFTLIQGTLILSIVVFLLSLIFMFRHRNSNPASSAAARTAMLICLVPLIGLGSQIFKARSVPPIHNISTDVSDPPSFFRVEQLRSKTDNPLEYDASVLAQLQQQAYPNIKTLHTKLPADKAFKRALVVVDALHWEIANDDAMSGVIEATETTALWAFKDDVVVRIRATEQGSDIDLRSVSRVGQSDLGANAARIERFLTTFQQ